MAKGYCSLCDKFTIGNICPPAGCLPGGARPCRHHEFPCSGRKRRAGRPGGVRSRSGGRRDRGTRGSEPDGLDPRPRSTSCRSRFRQYPPKRLPRSRYWVGRSPHRPPEPAAEAPVQAAPAAIPVPDAPPAAAVAQTEPANVNVSVRVNSPGDDGAVEQAERRCGRQYRQQPPQYQEPIPAPDAPPAASAAPPPPRSPPKRREAGTGRGNGTAVTPRPRSRSRRRRRRELDLELELELRRRRLTTTQ